jgi:hypothetical protein
MTNDEVNNLKNLDFDELLVHLSLMKEKSMILRLKIMKPKINL